MMEPPQIEEQRENDSTRPGIISDINANAASQSRGREGGREEQRKNDSTRPRIISDINPNAASQSRGREGGEIAINQVVAGGSRGAQDIFEPHASSSEVGENRRIPTDSRERVSDLLLPGVQSNEDSVRQLASALHSTLINFRYTSLSENNSRLVNRLTSARSLPTFSGEISEWMHFKDTFELTSELGGYSDRENVLRLYAALSGEAREIVSTLLSTHRDARTIMKTLELHYGNKKLLARKIVSELKNLPNMESGKIKLFASKLQSAIAALHSYNLAGYLHNPELAECIGNKLPTVLQFGYNTYAATVTNEKTDIEKLADFYIERQNVQ